MASKIELSRGNLLGKKLEGFGSAELFWEARSNGEDSQFKKWNEGTLWIGRPDVDGSNSEKNVAIPIAGGRIHNALVFRGLLTTERNKLDKRFEHARVGDFYVWDDRAHHDLEENGIDKASKTDIFRDTDDFRKGDILLIYSITGEDIPADQETNIDPDTGCLKSQDLIRYLRINNSGGNSKDTYFVTEDGKPFKQWEATNVEAALLELQFEKTEYVKVINTAADWPIDPVIGGLYLIGSDNLDFVNTEFCPPELKLLHPDKGDFLLYTRNTLYEDGKLDDDKKKYSDAYYWQLIPSGFTNADELDYYDKDRAQKKADFMHKVLNPEKRKTTFSEKHVADFGKNADTIHSALDFLMENKAMLDENGKVPLSQLHDTVLGAMQYKGTWVPYNLTEEQLTDDNYVVWDKDHTTCHLKETKYYHKLPGFERYDAGILDPDAPMSDVTAVQNGDYYIVKEHAVIYNLQYPCDQKTVPEQWELNSGDWIVFQGKGNIDEKSPGVIIETTDGFWSVIDNSDRLKSIDFTIDTITNGEFWTEPLDEPDTQTFVGSPLITASHKIGIVKANRNHIELVGDSLISQKKHEDSINSYYPRYTNTLGELENAYMQDIKANPNETPADIHTPVTENRTIIHSNVEIGVPMEKAKIPEQRTLTTFGDFKIKPHIDVTSGLSKEIKSIAQFYVNNADGEHIPFNIIAPDGTDTRQDEIKEDVAAHGVSEVNILIPENSSTLIGKLAGIELEEGRITKSIVEGYEESTSIEEHINTSEHDAKEDGDAIKDHHLHDEIHNIVELHSQLSAPVQNTYEIYFGAWHSDKEDSKHTYDSDDYDTSGQFAKNLMTRLTRNQFTEESNIEVLLPCHSGTLLLQEDIINLFGHDDDTYIPMFGQSIVLDKEGKRFNVLQRSPIRQVRNALRTQIKTTENEDTSFLTQVAKSQLADIFAPVKGPDEKRENCLDVKLSDTVVENDVIVGEFDNDGKLINGKSVYATKSLGVGDQEHAEGFLVPARTNFPNAAQYEDPYTLKPTPVLDVVVDMPNESGVMLTSNSRIDGGIFNETTLAND